MVANTVYNVGWIRTDITIARYVDGKSRSVVHNHKVCKTAEVPKKRRSNDNILVAWPNRLINVANSLDASVLDPVALP